jgi:hypothetical protein
MTAARARPADTAAVAGLLRRMLGAEEAGWSIGTFGALAEFHHVDGDPVPDVVAIDAGGEVVTARGGLRIAATAEVLPVAYEDLSGHPQAWSQALAFCLPEPAAAMGMRTVLTELGPDHRALRDDDRRAVLFDMGLGAPHVDVCVRTADPALIDVLRRAAGQSLLPSGSPAMSAIVAASPHRVCVSRLGRIEVYQPIPPPTPGARSPTGPHTHVLPELLKHRRTHSANAPIPDGWLAALNLFPASPIFDRLGHPRPFEADAHAEFQALMRAWGTPDVLAEKERIAGAVLAGEEPQRYPAAPTRAARTAARVALRQMLHTHPGVPGLRGWLSVFDHGVAQQTPANDAED